jgi:hypothetical protein
MVAFSRTRWVNTTASSRHELFSGIVVGHGGVEGVFEVGQAYLFSGLIGGDHFFTDIDQRIHHFGGGEDFVLVFLERRFQHFHQLLLSTSFFWRALLARHEQLVQSADSWLASKGVDVLFQSMEIIEHFTKGDFFRKDHGLHGFEIPFQLLMSFHAWRELQTAGCRQLIFGPGARVQTLLKSHYVDQ